MIGEQKTEENAARIRDKFSAENVDVVVNADETFLLFHPFGEKVIAPTGMKRVGSAVQVDNEKFGATVLIACEYQTSSILPPMIIFTGVYCAKLMTEWASYQKGNCFELLIVDCNTLSVLTFTVSFSQSYF